MRTTFFVIVLASIGLAVSVFWFAGNGGVEPATEEVAPTELVEEDEEAISDRPSVLKVSVDLLTANMWLWKETVLSSGEVVVPKQKGAFSITFSEEGNMSGTTDCNGFAGSYMLGNDGSLSFGSFMSTLMFCEGSQEAEFTGALTRVRSGLIAPSGDLVLSLPFDSGSVILTAAR